MKNLSKVLIIAGFILLAMALISKFIFPGILHFISMRSVSFVIWANTAFLLAILFKK